MEGANLTVTRDALRALASQAVKKGTGARALRSLLERLMLDVMYDHAQPRGHRGRDDQPRGGRGPPGPVDSQEAGSGRGVGG